MKCTRGLPLLSFRRKITRLAIFTSFRMILHCAYSYLQDHVMYPIVLITAIKTDLCHTRHFSKAIFPRPPIGCNHLPGDIVAISDSGLLPEIWANIVITTNYCLFSRFSYMSNIVKQESFVFRIVFLALSFTAFVVYYLPLILPQPSL